MKHPDTGHNWNKRTITRHILKVAHSKSVFRMIDLVRAYFSIHHTDGWQERLDALVAQDRLFTKFMPIEGWQVEGGRIPPSQNHYSLQPFT